jgi:hypothetical protein
MYSYTLYIDRFHTSLLNPKAYPKATVKTRQTMRSDPAHFHLHLQLLLPILPIISPLLIIHLTDTGQSNRLPMELRRIRRSKLSRSNLIRKQDIEFTISAALWFRETEVCPDETEGVEAEPEEGGFGAPAPGRGVKHEGGPDIVDYTANVVDVAGEDNCLGAETGGGEFGDEGVADGADCEIVCHGDVSVLQNVTKERQKAYR